MIIETEEIEDLSKEIDFLEDEYNLDLEEDTEFSIDIIELDKSAKVELTKKGELRKRKQKSSINYFTDETQEYIIKFLQSDDQKEKNKIFNDHIYPAFYKLCENIIHTFKFYYTEVIDLEDLKFEVISVLIEKIHLYHHSKNINDKLNKIINKIFKENYEYGSFINYTNNSIIVTQKQITEFLNSLNVSVECYNEISKITPPKAYSYFGTIAKRYLINYNKNNYKRLKNNVDPLEADDDKCILKDLELEFEKFDHSLEHFYRMYVNYMDDNLLSIFTKKHELEIAGAALSIFKNQNKLNLTDKKAIYLYMKEMVNDTPTRYITKVLKEFQKQYKNLYKQYDNYGAIKK